MNARPSTSGRRPLHRGLCALAFAALLGACSSSGDKPKPAELPVNPALVQAKQAWNNRVGAIAFPLQVQVSGDTLTLAGSDGSVVALDARSGRDLWRASAGARLSAGVGSDGRTAAVVTTGNDLVAFAAGKEVWRQRIPAKVFTAPLVAGARVFVQSADRSVSAFDAASGARLWSVQRPGEALVLSQSGVLAAFGDTLLVGIGGRLAALNPNNGALRWDAPVAASRGTNDIERLVDLVGRVSRDGDVVCVRAFQASVGCVSADRGALLWTRPANGADGLAGDSAYVFGVESDGKVQAWRRSSGEPVWSNERLRFRGLSAPLALGRTVAVGDAGGLVHLLSRADGSIAGRLSTDGSAIASAPVVAGGMLVVVTRNGGVFGFQPE